MESYVFKRIFIIVINFYRSFGYHIRIEKKLNSIL